MSKKARRQPKKLEQGSTRPEHRAKTGVFVVAAVLLFAIAFVAYRYTVKRSERRAVLTYAGSLDLRPLEPQVSRKINRLRKELEQDPASAEAWGKLAMNLHVHDLEKQAAPLYQKAASLDPSDFRWPYFCALLLSQSGSEEAFEWFKRAKTIRTDYVPLLIQYAEALVKSGKVDVAEEQYRAALGFDPNSSHAYFGLARTELQRGNVQASSTNLHQALRLNPKFGEAYHLLAAVDRRLGDQEGATKALATAESLPEKTPMLDPVYVDLTHEGESAVWYSFRGQEYLKKREYDSAIRELEIAHKIRANAQTHEDLGAAYISAGKLQQAMQQYKAAILLHPTPVNYHNLALIYARLGRGQESEAMFKKALELKPDYAEAYFNLGVLYAKAGNYEDTVKSLKQAIHFKPSYSNARYHLALAYLARGERNLAMEQYKALSTFDQKSADRLLDLLRKP